MSRRDLAAAAGAAGLLATASLPLSRVFVGTAWQAAAWGPLGAALLLAVVARRLRLGWVTAAAASAAGSAAFITAVYLPGGPMPDAPAFLGLLTQGLADLAEEPAPARPLPGLLLVVSIVWWWATHFAHELLVRARRPGSGIVTAAIPWAFSLAVPQPPGRTWPQAVPFLATAALVLLADPDPDLPWSAPASGRPRRAGLTLGAAAIAVGVLAPGLLPGYGHEPWVDMVGPGTARGYQPIVDVSRRLKLPASRDLLHVRATRPAYLRLAGLDAFDGSTWQLGPGDQPSFSPAQVIPATRRLPPEVPLERTRPLTVEVLNLSLENIFVPVPYHPSEVFGEGADRMVYSTHGSFVATAATVEGEPALVPGLSYGVRARVPTPSAAQLSTVGFDAYEQPGYRSWLALPRDYPQLKETADRILADAGADRPVEAAFALQSWLRDPDRFAYSTDVAPLRTPRALTRFVTTDRVGYCEYFATAMAVMLRLEGVPARVAVGFRPGKQVAADTYLVTTDDAHAWVEALFPGYGWISFEPTPALTDTLVPTPEQVVPTSPVGAGGRITDRQRPQQADGGADRREELAGRPSPPVTRPTGSQTGPAADHGGLLRVLASLAVVMTAGAVVVVAARRRRLVTAPGPSARVLASQRRVLTVAQGLGTGRRPSETFREATRRWVAAGRVEREASGRLTGLVEAAAFGGRLPASAARQAEQLADQLVAGLRASASRRERLGAPTVQALTAATDAGQRLLTRATLLSRTGRRRLSKARRRRR